MRGGDPGDSARPPREDCPAVGVASRVWRVEGRKHDHLFQVAGHGYRGPHAIQRRDIDDEGTLFRHQERDGAGLVGQPTATAEACAGDARASDNAGIRDGLSRFRLHARP